MNNEEIKNWFTGQHIQPVMLRQDWKQVILSKHLYTDNDVIELLTEFNKLLSQPTQGEGEIKEPIYEKVNGIYGYTVIMGGNKYHIYYNSVDDIECYLISESPKAECEGEKTHAELRAEFEMETNGLNWNLGGTWRFYAEWLEQKLTGKE